MLEVLREHLLEKPELLYLEEMAVIRQEQVCYLDMEKDPGAPGTHNFPYSDETKFFTSEVVIPHCSQGSRDSRSF
jgi:hypothetical protein